MSEINIELINENVEKAKKPKFCSVDEFEWRNALLGAQEALSNTDLDGYDTEKLWSTIYFCAVYFCKGMINAEIKAGLRKDDMYPRY